MSGLGVTFQDGRGLTAFAENSLRFDPMSSVVLRTLIDQADPEIYHLDNKVNNADVC